MFYPKELHKTNQTEFRFEKVIKKGVELLVIYLRDGLIKDISLHKMSQCFPKPYGRFGGNINI